ncbi:TetR/AcrR family transcriptional regulator [Paenibacillus sp. GCM10012306]|uniref:TetR/AcrR family transcriptional regulator n=1 Tax=Paenibacillus sp. GCM10012306 TaxID=3317342 RepID=UPI00361D1CB4
MNTLDQGTDHSDKDTKQTILDATVMLIKEEGFQCATLRKIASRADTNLALVNYYYGSKESLMSDAVRVLLSTFDDAFQALEDASLLPEERLKQFLSRYVVNLLRYPGLARQVLEQGPQIMCSPTEYDRYAKILRVKKMHNTLKEITHVEDDGRLQLMMLQLYGAVVIPALITNFPGKKEKITPVFDLPALDEQIDCLFEHYFSKYTL